MFGLHRTQLERHLHEVIVANWSLDPFTRGAYAVVPTGATPAQDALAEPVAHTLFFAGEATEPKFAGTVHGAILSGERAAHQVHHVLHSHRSQPLSASLR